MATKAKKRSQRTSRKKTPTRSTHVPTFNRICNIVPSRGTEKDWTLNDALAAGALTAAAALPASVDLRQSWWHIGDQEATGSCVGWASAEGVVRYHMVKAGKLAKTTQLSPRFVWMASKETDEYTTRPETFIEEAGTSLKAAMDICRKYGVPTANSLPFHINTLMNTGEENAFYAAAAQRRTASYFNLQKDTAKWKTWLAGHGPILAALSVDKTWDNASATGGNLDTFFPSTVRGGHAIAIVGYTSSGRFICRNSWNTTWGDHGFGYASVAYINAAFFNESYGVTV
ncbi:MAG TPA: C1 family peptidase [Povalibacter sp.]|nr:C1 family peptidase [Povalibacter sp.]